MKRAVSLVLAVCMIVMLAACGSGTGGTASSTSTVTASSTPGDKQAEKTKIKFWGLFSGGDGDIIKGMVDKFNEQSTSVNVELLNLKSEEYYTKLLTAMTSNTAPDIAISHISRLPEFVQNNLLLPIDDLAAKSGFKWEDINSKLSTAATIDGKHYAVPLDTHLLLLYHNIKILGDAGMLDAKNKPTLGTGKDAFIKYYSDVKGKIPGDVMPISGTSSAGLPMYLWYTLYSQAGGEILSSDGKTVTLVNDANKKALGFIDEIVKEGIWPKNQKSGSQIFSAGKAASTFNGDWGLPIFEPISSLKFDALPFPQIFDKQAVYADSHTFVFPKQSKEDSVHQDAAMSFAKWMVDNSILWAKAGHIPSKASVTESAEYKAMPYRSNYAKSADYAVFFPATTITVGITSVVQRHLASLISGELTVDQTMQKMQTDIEALLK